MAGPCTADSESISFGYEAPNLTADLIVSGQPDNAVEVLPDGVFVLRGVSRGYSSAAHNGLETPVAPGVSLTGYGVYIELDAYAYFGGPLDSNYPVSKPDTMTYKNTTAHNQWAEWYFVMPQTTYRIRGGWNVSLGLSTGVSGCALIPTVASLRMCNSLYTGYTKTKTSYADPDDLDDYTPLGATFPPTQWGGSGIIQPGETLTLERRLYLRVDGRGRTNAVPSNSISTILSPTTNLKVSTWV